MTVNRGETQDDARAQLRDIFLAGVAAADPYQSVLKQLQQYLLEVKDDGRLIILAIGKAALGMAEAALEHFSDHPNKTALAVTNYENYDALQKRIKQGEPAFEGRCYPAGHPVPDGKGLLAAQAVKELAHSAGADDFVLFLISGGGSALLPMPAEGLSLSDKMDVNAKLLASGADITEMNLVRQALSGLKGGRLAAISKPARQCSLILSDVIGDDLRVIASGPTIAAIGTPDEARDKLAELGLWDEVPQSVRQHLQQADAEAHARADHSPLKDWKNISNAILVGSNARSLDAMAEHCEGKAKVIRTPLVGSVEEAAAIIVHHMLETSAGQPVLFGGETTVQLKGDGRGGRNQELALQVATLMQEAGYGGDWVFLSGGTDGRDGPTDAAGAIVDGGSLDRIRAKGGDPKALLENNDSYQALSLSGDLLITGATGTNVADLQIALRL